jgi:molybdopterin synthase catalytic subunit
VAEELVTGVGVCHVAIVDTPIDVGRLQARVAHPGIGAITMFLGTVRNVHEGRDVTGIDYEAYQPMAERELTAIARETCASTAGLQLAIEHRVGALVVGDVSVAIAAAHARRAPSLAAAQHVIEVLKQRVPIWKREHYSNGERRWVDPTVPTPTTEHA